MKLTVVEESPPRLAEYARVSIGFTVAEVFDEQGVAALLRGASATPVVAAAPYWKDYDASSGCHPTAWPARFDMSRWTCLAAYVDERRVGGVVIIVDDPDVDLLGDCRDCALLWDLRVAPDARTQGVGTALLGAAEHHAARRGARVMRVETQQVNVPACRFYRRHGFRLERAVQGAYVDLPHEVQLLWHKTLI